MSSFILSQLQVLLLLAGLSFCLGSSTVGGAGSIEAPVPNIRPSWTASCAQGTVVALRHRECILVFLRSPSSNLYRPPLPKANEELFGLKVTAVSPLTVEFAPSWLTIGPHSLCAMTGLASDVEHLARVLQQEVDTHWNVYDKHMTTHSMAMTMAEVFQEATFSGDRPYGVQCLLVGSDDLDKERTFGVYSIDPSGAWQSWGGATAIGKSAKLVREELAKKRSEGKRPASLQETLELIVDCWLGTYSTLNMNLRSEDDYQVLVLHKGKGQVTSKLYAVDPEFLQSIVDHQIKVKTEEAI